MENFITSLLSFWEKHGGQIISALIVFAVGSIAIRLVCKITRKGLSKSRLSLTIHQFIISVLNVALYVILGLTILQIFNVPMTSIVAALGVVGLAVSLSVQNSLANVAGGIVLLFTKPFEVGDYILFDDVEGTVAQISILNTKMCTFDNKFIYIPNGKLSEDKIVNFTASGTRRLDLDISISYQNDFHQAIALIEAVIEKEPMVIKDEEEKLPLVRMNAHGESAIILTVKVWATSADFWPVRYNLLEAIKDTFDAHNISIPYQQMEVRLHKE